MVLPAMYFVLLDYRVHIFRAVLETLSQVSQKYDMAAVGAMHTR